MSEARLKELRRELLTNVLSHEDACWLMEQIAALTTSLAEVGRERDEALRCYDLWMKAHSKHCEQARAESAEQLLSEMAESIKRRLGECCAALRSGVWTGTRLCSDCERDNALLAKYDSRNAEAR